MIDKTKTEVQILMHFMCDSVDSILSYLVEQFKLIKQEMLVICNSISRTKLISKSHHSHNS